MKSGFVLGLIGIGFLMLILSGLWGTLFPPTKSWTTDKAQRISQVKARLNDLSAKLYSASQGNARAGNAAALKAEYDQLLKEHEDLKLDFETVSERPRTVATVLKWSGISLAVVGLIGWYAVKQANS